ncbi:MAG: succinate dehydrogenase cytochrome b subunit [Saprospiraceae bacterium]|nr:succinate dehydrogenase cytochrome b subunit [Saprospiraceae bacterium]
MNWIFKFLTSSIGKKIVMSLTGLFLCLFLVVHMIGNLQLLVPFVDAADQGKAFNEYAYIMTHNPLIKAVSYVTYAFILLHAFQGILIAVTNRSAASKTPQGKRYYGKEVSPTPARQAARNMALLGTIILAFIGLHMAQFWGVMHFSTWEGEILPGVQALDGNGYKNLYGLVNAAFQEAWVVIVYVISVAVLSMHLMHGFQSAFQTLGLNHKRYTPLIKGLGTFYSVAIPLGFASMPIIMFIASK